VDGALDLAYALALVLALWANGLAVGLAHGRRELVRPLRRVRLVAAVAVVDVVAVPLLVWALVRAFGVPGDDAVGLLLVGIASAGPLGIAVTQLARGDVALAAALVVVLELANLVAIPLWAIVLLPDGVDVPVAQMVATLLALVVAPVGAGALWRHRSAERGAVHLVRPLRVVSVVALAAVVAIVLARDGDALGETFGEQVPIVAALAVAGAFVLGWLAGSGSSPTRAATALVTSVRASGPALAIAAASFPGRDGVRLAIVVFALVGLTGSCLAALVLARTSATSDRLSPALERD
jgi:BASS family bile acid:Na+ symporter